MKKLYEKYKSLIAYVFWGGVTTLINIVVFGLCTRLGMSTSLSNVLAWALSVLAAYLSNRRWVFQSESRTALEIARELLSFVACRVGTGLLDQLVMVIGVDRLGPLFVPTEYAFLWSMTLKVASNVLVIILNYVLSRLLVFKSGKRS